MKTVTILLILAVASVIYGFSKSETAKAIRYSSSEERTNKAYNQFRVATDYR